MDPRTARSPSLSSSPSKTGSSQFPPLSNHGMPKTPALLSPDGSIRPHRFSGLPSSPRPSEPPVSPMSPMSQPMSAKSFGTFIDSEPSTPAYSPRMGSTWDSSTLVLLSPVSSTSTVPSPVEPVWEMMTPLQKPPKRISVRHRKKPSLAVTKEISIETSLSSHPITPIPGRVESQKENQPPAEEEKDTKTEEQQETQAAPLEKLATRMRSLLRRKNTTEKKAEKRRRGYYELDRVETVHWTEM